MLHLFCFIERFETGVKTGTWSACHRQSQHVPKYTDYFAPSPIQNTHAKVHVSHLKIQKSQACPLLIFYTVLVTWVGILHAKAKLPQHRCSSTQQRRQTHISSLYCFQGNNAAEPKVILSQVCGNPSWMVTLTNILLYRKCSKNVTCYCSN